MIRRRKQVSATLLTFLSHSDFECCLLSPPHVLSSGLPSARGPPEALVQNHGETLAVNCELLALPDPAAWVPDEKSRKGCPGPGSQEAMLQRPRALRLPSHPRIPTRCARNRSTGQPAWPVEVTVSFRVRGLRFLSSLGPAGGRDSRMGPVIFLLFLVVIIYYLFCLFCLFAVMGLM